LDILFGRPRFRSEELKHGKLKTKIQIQIHIEIEFESGAKAMASDEEQYLPVFTGQHQHNKQAALIVIVNLTILLPIAK